MRAARLRVAASAGRGQHGSVGGDRKCVGKFTDRKIASGCYFDGQIFKSVVPGVEERLNRHSRLVVEQNDQLFADVTEDNLLVGDIGELDLAFLLIAYIDNDRLIGQRLGQFEYAWGRSVIGISRAGSLRNLKL